MPNKQELEKALGNQGRRRGDQRLHGSAVVGELPLQNLSPTDGVRASGKIERERLSFDPLKAKQKASPRFSMQDPQLGGQANIKAATHGMIESLSEISPDFRLQNNFDHEMILSGQQTTENLQHAITAQKNPESEVVEFSQFDNEQVTVKDLNKLMKQSHD